MTMQDHNGLRALIDGLKVGDKVLIDIDNLGHFDGRLETITKVTNHYIRTERNTYSKETGYISGKPGVAYSRTRPRPRIASPAFRWRWERQEQVERARYEIKRAGDLVANQSFRAAKAALTSALATIETLKQKETP